MESPDELEEGPLSDLSENISKSLDDGKRQTIYWTNIQNQIEISV